MYSAAFQAARIANSRLRNLKSLVLNSLARPVVVLGYHRVAATGSDPAALTVSPAHFREHMAYLKRHHRLVRFEEDWSDLREPAVAVTFDDGYVDNLKEALPVLEELGIPATFFVTSGYLEAAEFWWDELERLVLRGSGYPSRFVLEGFGEPRSWATASEPERESMYRDMVRLAMRAPVEKREELLRQLRRWCAAPAPRAPSDRPLTCAELRSLAESRLVTIGAHAVSHASLTALPEQEQASEILSSKARLQEILGREVSVFSYPFGSANDCSATTARLCKSAGFRKAATAWPGQHYRWSDPLQIPRNFIQDFDLDSFVVKVKSFWI